ncbi:MAG: hypothetical protein K9J80_17130 [Sulfuritalea sp.]|nr:hypothetical protein [Sulfuritalea sp.]
MAVMSILLAGLLPALSQLDFTFMPKGGKTLLLELLGTPPDKSELRKIAETRRTEAEWLEALSVRTENLDETQRRTLAAYLAVNMPLQKSAIQELEKQGGAAISLPRDGRDLAWNECQFCHSLFSSHLTQDRSVQAWLNMFQSPFHREMKMTAQEREEFAHYSTINMPMKIEDVPPDLRF